MPPRTSVISCCMQSVQVHKNMQGCKFVVSSAALVKSYSEAATVSEVSEISSRWDPLGRICAVKASAQLPCTTL